MKIIRPVRPIDWPVRIVVALVLAAVSALGALILMHHNTNGQTAPVLTDDGRPIITVDSAPPPTQ